MRKNLSIHIIFDILTCKFEVVHMVTWPRGQDDDKLGGGGFTPVTKNMSHAAAVRDLKASLNTNQYAKSIAQLKNLATIGNSAACEIYGDMLMEGVWNTYQMKVDGIANKLIGAYDFQGKDPYLLLPRDPVAAIDYYKKASGNRDTARAKLAYCKKMGYAGLPKQNKIDSSVKITSEMKEFLDKNAKSATAVDKNDLEASDKFVPLPDRRPKVQDPATSMFRKMAEYWGYRSIYQFAILEIIIFFVTPFDIPFPSLGSLSSDGIWSFNVWVTFDGSRSHLFALCGAKGAATLFLQRITSRIRKFN